VKNGSILWNDYNSNTPKLPSNWHLINGYLIGHGADLTGADLTGTDLTGTDLTNANLTGVISGSIVWNDYDSNAPKLPLDWKLINGYLIGPGSVPREGYGFRMRQMTNHYGS